MNDNFETARVFIFCSPPLHSIKIRRKHNTTVLVLYDAPRRRMPSSL